MIWLVVGLLVLVVVLLGMLHAQGRDLHAARRRIALLTLAWRRPDSVAGRDILPEAHARLRYQILGELADDGAVECIPWGERFLQNRRYMQYRYRLLRPGMKQIVRKWR